MVKYGIEDTVKPDPKITQRELDIAGLEKGLEYRITLVKHSPDNGESLYIEIDPVPNGHGGRYSVNWFVPTSRRE